MDIKYDFKENPFVEKDGKPVLYLGVVVNRTLTTEDIVAEVSRHSGFSSGCVMGVLAEVSDLIVSSLRDGCNVRLDELGTFSLSLSSREVTDRKEIRAASISIEKVNFRPVPDLVKRVRSGATLMRAEYGFRPSSKEYSKEERWEVLREYLQEYGAITRMKYSSLTGLARSTAALELKRWREEKKLLCEGRHSHVVYRLNE